MEFSNQIWLKVGEHEYKYIYKYIFEIELEKIKCCLKMAPNTSFVTLRKNAK